MRIALLSLLVVCSSAVYCTAETPADASAAGTFISGSAVDADTGAPVPDVGLYTPTTDASGTGAGVSTRSDEDGSFRLAVSPGEHVLRYGVYSAVYEDGVDPSLRLSVPETGLSDVVVKIPRRQVVVGCVRDSSRSMVAAASVTVGPPGWNMGAITDNKGRFVLTLPPRTKCSPG